MIKAFIIGKEARYSEQSAVKKTEDERAGLHYRQCQSQAGGAIDCGFSRDGADVKCLKTGDYG